MDFSVLAFQFHVCFHEFVGKKENDPVSLLLTCGLVLTEGRKTKAGHKELTAFPVM